MEAGKNRARRIRNSDARAAEARSGSWEMSPVRPVRRPCQTARTRIIHACHIRAAYSYFKWLNYNLVHAYGRSDRS
jgi:hypothetical protein